MISPELAHRSGKGEAVIYKLVTQGWEFKESSFLDRHKNEDVRMVMFKSPKMKSFSTLLEREWNNITIEYLKKREKESLL